MLEVVIKCFSFSSNVGCGELWRPVSKSKNSRSSFFSLPQNLHALKSFLVFGAGMNTATIALRRMILHLAITEFRPKPAGHGVFLKNRQKQSLRAALERITFKCDMNLPSQSDIS